MSKAQWIKDNLKPGEEYAGIILGKDGEQDYHLILLPGEIEARQRTQRDQEGILVEEETWNQIGAWATKLGVSLD